MSTDPINERFLFQSEGAPEKAFRVVRFSGREGLNVLYRFEITLASQSKPDLEKVLASPAKLTILRDDGKHAVFHGYPTLCAQGGHSNGWTFYTLTLQPAFWKTTHVVMNQIFLDKDVKEILEEMLKRNGAFESKHDFKLEGSYPKLDFSMQYNESVYDYMAFLMEKNGIYYFFDQQDAGEKLIFADSKDAHVKLPQTPTLRYSPVSGLENAHREEVIASFILNQTPLPKIVFVRDHDWKRPGQAVEASAPVSSKGLGSVYHYGDGFSTEAEGKRIAGIRAGELICRSKVYTGGSSVPTMRPGFIFALEGHYDDAFNQEYAITEVIHEGSQEGFLSLALGIELSHPSDKLYYRNSFSCIPADVQFRPARVTERKKISGALTAFIDAASNTGVAETDEHGRYKVVFPLDPSGRGDGKASCWIRRAQPYVGSGYGSSFPLSPGVEVFVSFLGGDPDRPFIVGAVSNPETGSMDAGATAMLSGLTTNGGNGLIFNDKPEKQGIFLGSGGKRSGLFMTSGSLDGSFLKSDTNLNLFTSSNTAMAGLASMTQAGFANSIETSGGTVSWDKMLLEVLNTLETITKGGLKADPNSEEDVYKGWSHVGSGIKIAGTLAALGINIKEAATLSAPGTPYGTSISGTVGESSIRQLSKMTPGRQKEFIAFSMAHMVATIGQGVLQMTVDKKSKKEQDEFDELTEFQKWETRRDYIITSAKELIGEISSLVTLLLKRDSAWGLRKVEFGGIKVAAPEENVAITSETETRVASTKQTVIQALFGAPHRVEEYGANELPECYKNSNLVDDSKSRVLIHSEQIRNLAHDSLIDYSLKDMEMHALDKVVISNKPEKLEPIAAFVHKEAQDAFAKQAFVKKPDPDTAKKAAFVTALETRKADAAKRKAPKAYSELIMDKEKLNMLNEGKEMLFVQKASADDAVMGLTRSNATGEVNKVSLTKDGSVVSYKKGGSGKPRVVELLDGKAAVSADKTAMTAEDKKITLAAEGTAQFTLEKDKATVDTTNVEVKGKSGIKLDSPDIKVGDSSFTKPEIELKATSIKINGTMVQIA